MLWFPLHNINENKNLFVGTLRIYQTFRTDMKFNINVIYMVCDQINERTYIV